MLSWVPAYPWDKLKTLWQTRRDEDSLSRLVRSKLRVEGLGFFYRGFSATLVRAVPQTGVTLATYDLVAAHMLRTT